MMVDGWDGQIRVLHVDDDPAIGGLVSDFFEQEDEPFEVTTASSADEGLSTLRDGEFECVVSDYQLSGTDGLELLQAVREEYSSLPFILFTGKGSEEIASEAIASGVTDYLQKGGPERYTVLANRVRNAVDQYRAHVELDRTREWFRTLIENSTDVTTVVDEECVIQYQSPTIERCFGYEPDELIGRNSLEYVHPDDREEVRRTFEAFAESSEDLVHRFRHADGSWRWLRSGVSDQRDTIVDGYVVNSRDVTVRKRQREQFRTLVEEAGDTIFIVDKAGHIEYATPGVEELLGYRSGKLVGRNGFDRIHPDDLAEAMAGFTAAVAEPAGRSAATFRYRHADGSWIRLDGRVRNLLDDPVVDGLVVYVREVTESRDSLAGTIANSRES